jgi:hypothetical protein
MVRTMLDSFENRRLPSAGVGVCLVTLFVDLNRLLLFRFRNRDMDEITNAAGSLMKKAWDVYNVRKHTTRRKSDNLMSMLLLLTSSQSLQLANSHHCLFPSQTIRTLGGGRNLQHGRAKRQTRQTFDPQGRLAPTPTLARDCTLERLCLGLRSLGRVLVLLWTLSCGTVKNL